MPVPYDFTTGDGYTPLYSNSSSEEGYAALWVGFAFSFFAMVVFFGITYLNDSPKHLVFNYITTTIVTVLSLSYLAMALGGTSGMTTYTSGPWAGESRPFLWVRYGEWAVTGPLILLDLALLAGINFVEVTYVSFLYILYVVALWFGAWTAQPSGPGQNATWPLFVFAVVCLLPVWLSLYTNFMLRAAALGSKVSRIFNFLVYWTIAFQIGYLLVWATSQGGYNMNIEQEVICYTVLDIGSKVIFGFVLLFNRKAVAV